MKKNLYLNIRHLPRRCTVVHETRMSRRRKMCQHNIRYSEPDQSGFKFETISDAYTFNNNSIKQQCVEHRCISRLIRRRL